MVHNKFGKAMDRIANFLEEKERKGKKKVMKVPKAPKPISEHLPMSYHQLSISYNHPILMFCSAQDPRLPGSDCAQQAL